MFLTAPVLIAVVGLLLWALVPNSKVSEAGRILFFCGALVATERLSGQKLL